MAKYEEWISPEGLLLMEGWARDGLTDEQIAHNMGIARGTLYDWKKKFPAMSDALKKGKEVVDRQVENALLKRALGYSYTETTRERIIDTGQKKRHGGEQELTEKEWEFSVRYFGNKCCYCGRYMEEPTKDHIKPLISGGKMSKDNIIPCCRSCNSSKKDNEMVPWYQSRTFYDEARLQKIYDYLDFVSDIDSFFDEFNEELFTTKEVTKEVLPDVTAQIFWLKNRKPDKWRASQYNTAAVEADTDNEDTGVQIYLPEKDGK